MTTIADVIDFMNEFAPQELAEEWDNVGLLVGRRQADVTSIMTCLTLTMDVADEAIEKSCSLIVTHHPVLFRPVQRLTDETSEGEMLLRIAEAGIGVYCPHTSYDSAPLGINQQLSELLGLQGVRPLRPSETDESLGSGRFGTLSQACSLQELIARVKSSLEISSLEFVGDPDGTVRTVGVACGSAAEFLADAQQHGCEVLLTGEARFHACLEARARGMGMILAGHYASERPALVRLAEIMTERFPQIEAWASHAETNPLQWG